MIQLDAFKQEEENAQRLVEGVHNLLDQLPGKLFRIGIDQRVSIERVLLVAINDGLAPNLSLAELLPLIGPVICNKPEQQDFFRDLETRLIRDEQKKLASKEQKVFQEADKLASAERATLLPEEDTTGDPETDALILQLVSRRKRFSVLIFLVALLLSVLTAVLFNTVTEKKIDIPLQEEISSSIPETVPAVLSHFVENFITAIFDDFMLPWFLALIPLVLSGYAISRRKNLQRFLEKRLTAENSHYDTLKITGSPFQAFGSQVRKRLLALRTPLQVPSGNLDLPRTLRATMKSCGHPVLHFATKRLSPEYLILGRRLTDHDHLEYMSEALVGTMRREEIHVRHYAFWRESVRLMEIRGKKGDGAPDRNLQDLETLSTRFPRHRLIVMDEARLLIGRRGLLSTWADTFRAWPEKVWITPVSRAQWGFGESAAASLGFQVLSLDDPDPLTALGSLFNEIAHEPEPGKTQSFPRSLIQHSAAFMSEEPPSPQDCALLVMQLKEYLGTKGFRWLQACSVFPALEPKLTQYLGESLLDDNNRPFYSLSRLAALSRLPWFETGEIPDWLREP